jgi:Concanavalin A-like lectin/glucanases superfamily
MLRLVRGAAGAAVLSVVVAGLGLVPATGAWASTNLLSNGSFDGGSTSGWRGTNASLSAVSPGYGGSAYAARVALSNTATAYAMYAYPKPATNVPSGEQFQASGEVLGVAGRYICLQLHEAGSVAQTVQQCQKATGAWQALGPVTLTDKGAGDSVGYTLRQTGAQAGDSFQADSLSMTVSTAVVAGLWHMNETSGTVMADSSGNGNNGTLYNVTLGAAGKYGTSYTFNGKSSYVEVPDAPSLNPGSANISISLWLRTYSLPSVGDYDLVRKGVFTAPEYKVELLQSGAIQCTFRGTTSNANATGGSGLNNGAWHHIQCIKTGSQIQTVIDGTVVATTNAAVGSISNTYALEIGAYPGSDWYKGKLDEMSITIG